MNLVRLLLDTGRAMVEAPSRWTSLQWASFVAFTSLTVLAWLNERSLQGYLQGRGGNLPGTVATFANLAGSGFAVTGLGLLALAVGSLARKEDLIQAAVVLGVAGLWAFLMVQAGQFALAEPRPMDGGAMRLFASGGHGVSGHAAATALLVLPARDVWLRRATLRSRRAASVLLTVWAVVVGWSRVWMGMHFAWNVLAGFAIGFWASAGAVAAWHGSRAGAHDRE